MAGRTGAAIIDCLGRWRFLGNDELALHIGIEHALRAGGLDPRREVRLNDHDRIDFLVGVVGIEVKVAGSIGPVARQLRRYAESPMIDELILVTTRVQLTQVPTTGLKVPLTVLPFLHGIV